MKRVAQAVVEEMVRAYTLSIQEVLRRPYPGAARRVEWILRDRMDSTDRSMEALATLLISRHLYGEGTPEDLREAVWLLEGIPRPQESALVKMGYCATHLGDMPLLSRVTQGLARLGAFPERPEGVITDGAVEEEEQRDKRNPWEMPRTQDHAQAA